MAPQDLAAGGEKGEELRGSLRLFLWNFRHLVGCKRYCEIAEDGSTRIDAFVS